MKDLILVGAYCPDNEREELLNNLIIQLQPLRENFDILICSHTIIPEYITKKVDYVFYDKNNNLIYETKYLNQPWFSPFDGMTILSTYIGDGSTYLSVYRILISGLSIAKTFGYEKVHYIEYDTDFCDLDEIYLHSNLLDEYDWISIQKEEKNYEENLSWPIGNFYSFNMNVICDALTTYDESRLLDILQKSNSKTNEKITLDFVKSYTDKILIRDFNSDISKLNKYGLSKQTDRESLNYWCVPFYDTRKKIVSVVVWNNKDTNPIDVNFIINNNHLLYFGNIQKYEWSIKDIGLIEDINSILIIVNGRVKNKIIINDNNREDFKNTNYTIYS